MKTLVILIVPFLLGLTKNVAKPSDEIVFSQGQLACIEVKKGQDTDPWVQVSSIDSTENQQSLMSPERYNISVTGPITDDMCTYVDVTIDFANKYVTKRYEGGYTASDVFYVRRLCLTEENKKIIFTEYQKAKVETTSPNVQLEGKICYSIEIKDVCGFASAERGRDLRLSTLQGKTTEIYPIKALCPWVGN
ncbi:MAG: hypothetical protein EOP06_07570 [Proteobacteria bacterium]|nr:MAG: hypothetical protein EOP06_07570 [Pseudomonadota bacterium]